MNVVLHWFRRDLRLADNTALAAAARCAGRVIPVFLLEDSLRIGPEVGAARLAFLLQTLESLRNRLAALGCPLIIRSGRAEDVLPRLCAETGAQAVFANKRRTPGAGPRPARGRGALPRRGRIQTVQRCRDLGGYGNSHPIGPALHRVHPLRQSLEKQPLNRRPGPPSNPSGRPEAPAFRHPYSCRSDPAASVTRRHSRPCRRPGEPAALKTLRRSWPDPVYDYAAAPRPAGGGRHVVALAASARGRHRHPHRSCAN